MIDDTILRELAERSGLRSASIVIEPAGRPGAGAVLAPDAPIYPASMIKVPIALALALRCEGGEHAWSDEVGIAASNVSTNDAPSAFVANGRATLAALCRAMLSASDNTATNVLIDVLGRERIGPALEPFGLCETAVRRKLSGSEPLVTDPQASGRNTHPASDAARLLHAIDRRRERRACPVFDALAAQRWNDKLSRGLQPGDGFAHKTGDTDDVSHDGGILTLAGGRRYILVVYTPLPATPPTEAAFGAFAAELRARL